MDYPPSVGSGGQPETRAGGLLEFVADFEPGGEVPERIEIDGRPTAVRDRRAVTVLRPHFGLNVVKLRSEVEERSRDTFCSFVAASSFVPSGLPLRGGLQVHVDRSVFDGPQSLATGLEDALAPFELREALEEAIGGRPLRVERCGRRPLGRCLMRASLSLEGATSGGPHHVELTPGDDGLELVVELVELGVALGLDGRLSLVDYQTSGWVRVDRAVLEARVELNVERGMPVVSWLRSPSVDLQGLRVDFEGLDGAVVDAFVKAFGRTLRSRMERALSARVKSVVERAVERQLSRFGREGLVRRVDVPALPGGRSATLSISGDLEQLDVTPTGIEMSTSVAVDGVGEVVHQGIGAPVRRRVGTPSTDGPLSVHLDVAVAAATLYELWTVGWLDLSLEPGELDRRLPLGTRVALTAGLPPVLDTQGDLLGVGLGRVQARADIPGAPEPLVLELDLRLRARPVVRDDTMMVEPEPVEVLGVDVLEGGMFTRWEAALQQTVRDALTRRTADLLDRAWVAMPPIEFPMPRQWPSWFHLPRALELAALSTSVDESWIGVTGRMRRR